MTADDYLYRQERTRAVVEWRGAGEAVARSAYAMADSFDSLCAAWAAAARAVIDAAEAVERLADSKRNDA
jgi:hypothetical protein